MYLKIIFIAILFAQSFSASALTVPLWQGVIPNSQPTSKAEGIENPRSRKISFVTEPALELFMPASSNNRRKAIVICPGGGYKILAYDKEGTDFAKFLNGHGFTAIVLKYRLPDASINVVPHLSPIIDLKRAVEWVRENAADLEIDDVGVMGFSAGGHLASTLGVHFDPKNRPDFMALIYPVITMHEPYTHEGSKISLLGEKPDSELVNYYSAELNVSSDTPPTFIVHSFDDMSVPIENSLLFAMALKQKGIPLEMHTYALGGHGFAFGMGRGRVGEWPDLLIKWLKSL